MHYTYLFLTLLALNVGLRWWLNQRQIQSVIAHRQQVPPAFQGHISLQSHQRAADYNLAHLRLSVWEAFYDALLLLLWTVGGGLQSLSSGLALVIHDNHLHGTLLIVSVFLITGLLALPWQLYRTFVIEAHFGFNRTTPRIFIADILKAALLLLLFGTPVAYAVLWLISQGGVLWWLWVWLLLSILSLIISFAYPRFIAPLFNRFTPLQDQALKQAIQTLLAKTDINSESVYIMDGSRRSHHGNAYFSGLGKSKRIVLFDTLLDRLQREEIIAILAHELGHYHYRHVLKGTLLSSVGLFFALAALAWYSAQPELQAALGITQPNPALILLSYMMVLPVLTFILTPLGSLWSRRHEFQADAYAASQTGQAALISALLKLYDDNAATLTPDALYATFYYSHPPATERIAHLQGHSHEQTA